MSVLLVVGVGMSQSLVGSMELTAVNRETALATDALRETIELLDGVEDFQSVYRRYNADPGDDPAAGPAPGSDFAVAGLQPLESDPDGMVGEIVFPTLDVGGGPQLREDVVDPLLGMPRDLDGDGIVDGGDRSDDYRLLPVLVRIRWQGRSGERSMEARALLADR